MIGDDSDSSISAFESGIAGALSGAFSRALLQPLDVLKIRFQLQIEPINRLHGHYHGILQATRSILCNEGIHALWKGHLSAQALSVMYGMGQFGAYTFLKNRAIEAGMGRNQAVLVGCGAAAGVVGTVTCQPFDVARTVIVAQSKKRFSGTLSIWRHIVAEEGVLRLWKGLTPTLLMTVPFATVQLRLYSILSTFFSDVFDTDMLGYRVSSSVICGTVAGVCAKAFVYPLDVLKKRIQLMGMESIRRDFGQVVVYRSMWHCVQTVTRQEGPRAWFKGLQPSLIKSGAVSALVFLSYDALCHLILSTKSTQPDHR